ncbi:hypothetical protein BLA29_002142 [Euroglyphus maynei]|uniref:Uncharacterized protein n=1 Tax=Euroglyphus maynei TaxID=6958 RepID=A0A1Y3BLK7_EURMA|nr:hypothetical protein BLA29_002142 [Euroglyphus maynei]
MELSQVLSNYMHNSHYSTLHEESSMQKYHKQPTHGIEVIHSALLSSMEILTKNGNGKYGKHGKPLHTGFMSRRTSSDSI